jgi:RNA polymerase sigma-70 factor (ECF subfamily)
MPSDERELVRRLKAGDRAAFEEMVRLHGPRLLALTRRYLPNRADAEDSLQEAFLNVFRCISSFAGDSRFGTWLHRVTVNSALMRLRARRRRPETLVEDAWVAAAGASPGGVPVSTLVDEAARREAREVVHRYLERLGEEWRIVVRLRDIEGLEVHEISRVLGLGVSTVKSRLRRGRSELSVLIQAHFAR